MELLNRDRLSQTDAASEHALSDEAIQAIAAVIADFINTKNSDLARLPDYLYPKTNRQRSETVVPVSLSMTALSQSDKELLAQSAYYNFCVYRRYVNRSE